MPYVSQNKSNEFIYSLNKCFQHVKHFSGWIIWVKIKNTSQNAVIPVWHFLPKLSNILNEIKFRWEQPFAK